MVTLLSGTVDGSYMLELLPFHEGEDGLKACKLLTES